MRSNSGWIFRIATRALEWFSFGCAVAVLGVMVAFFTYEIVARYLFNSPTGFANQFGAYAMPALTFLGASLALRRGAHVRVDWFVENLPSRGRALVYLAGDVVGLLAIAWCFWLSIQLVQRTEAAGTRTFSAATAFPEWIPQMTIVVGLGALAATQLSLVTEEIAASRKRGKSASNDDPGESQAPAPVDEQPPMKGPLL